MKAFLIDPYQQQVTEVEIENKLEAFYEQCDCSMIQFIGMGDSGHNLICDEEGMFKEEYALFMFEGLWSEPLVGKALLVSVNLDTGECEDATMDINEIKRSVLWHQGHFWESAASVEGIL